MAAVMAAVLRYLCNYGPNYFAELCYEPKFLGTHPRKMTVEDTCASPSSLRLLALCGCWMILGYIYDFHFLHTLCLNPTHDTNFYLVDRKDEFVDVCICFPIWLALIPQTFFSVSSPVPFCIETVGRKYFPVNRAEKQLIMVFRGWLLSKIFLSSRTI